MRVKMRGAAALVALIIAPSAALRVTGGRLPPPSAVADAAKAAFVAGALSASLIAGAPPALAQSLNEAIVEVSQSSYPIIGALQKETFVPFSEKIANLILAIPEAKLGKAVDLGVDVLLTAKPEPLSSLNALVKESYQGVETGSCTLVPLPSSAAADKFKSIAEKTVDAAKLKAFSDTYGPTLAALPKTADAICLPSKDALDKLALAQAEVGRSYDADAAKKFESYATPVLKGSISLGNIFPLINDAKQLAPGATSQQKAAFTAAGKRIEGAARLWRDHEARSRGEVTARSRRGHAEITARSRRGHGEIMRRDHGET